ncbi:MAG: hypothetical protein AUI14_10130 [Actinobacteria bacterium 13_2_20CM_2_71_6]|nr:MAG: hypothetical protein AUI14_10130 [Actinobacteria bacterium 13_2_20CM_2_71_6]
MSGTPRGRRAILASAVACLLAGQANIGGVHATFTSAATGGGAHLTSRNSFQLTQTASTAGCVSEDGLSGACADDVGLKEPAGLAVTHDNTFLYVASYSSSGVAAFSRDTTTGALTQLSGNNACVTNATTTGCALGKALSQPWGIAISPDDKNVYTASYGSSGVAAFSRDTTTGVLTQLSGTNGCVTNSGTSGTCATGKALGGADGIAVSPDGAYVYVASYSDAAVAVFSRNSSTGVLTQLSGTSGCVSNSGTSGTCVVGKGMTGVVAITVSPDGGGLYTASDTDNAVGIFSRNTGTGVLTQLSGTGGCISNTGSSGACVTGSNLAGSYDVAVSPDSASVYVAASTSGAITVYSRNTGTSALTQLSGTSGCVSDGGSGGCATGVAMQGLQTVTVSPDGQDVYGGGFTSDAVSVFKRKSDGSLSQWAATRGCISNTGTSGSCTTGRGLGGIHRVTVAPDGRDVYTGGTHSTATGSVAILFRTH